MDAAAAAGPGEERSARTSARGGTPPGRRTGRGAETPVSRENPLPGGAQVRTSAAAKARFKPESRKSTHPPVTFPPRNPLPGVRRTRAVGAPVRGRGVRVGRGFESGAGPRGTWIVAAHIFQMVAGILGNVSLIMHISVSYSGCKSRSTDLILRHLAVANSLIFLSQIPEATEAFGMKKFLCELWCKLVLYVHRVARGVSIGSTCLLSVFQAVTISPGNSRWAGLKLKAPHYIGPCHIFCWILHLLINATFPIYHSVKRSNETMARKNTLGYCEVPMNDKITFSLFAVLISSHDALCLGLMSWASGSMILVLYRHKQQVKSIHRNNLSPKSSPETRASQSILTLVGTFVSFYALSSIIYAYLALWDNSSRWLVHMSALITSCFPTVSPFILLSSRRCVLRPPCMDRGRNTQLPSLIRQI
ncbi:PREDICTED: vomeronasal type-1 receptor 2-like [Elephantulus edwardii]|uniref:vomeronasal type-1 receptor 2-like n=1 Tax=Elephantulus edwardii TaxID=28737 RepID=UPI0003F06667|nr:PREDICTED: vomeronasal type-1 receptor 2-like [Elephantulus edwardii]